MLPAQIAKIINEPKGNIESWVKEFKIPGILSARMPERRAFYEKEICISLFEESLDFAYFLGAYTATTNPNFNRQNLRFKSCDLSIVKTLCGASKSFLGSNTPEPIRTIDKKSKDGHFLYEVRALSAAITRHINNITTGN